MEYLNYTIQYYAGEEKYMDTVAMTSLEMELSFCF